MVVAKEKPDAVDEVNAMAKKSLGVEGMVQTGLKPRERIVPVPSRLDDLDHGVLTLGGFPLGRVVELAGPKSAGKSLVASRVTGSLQRMFQDRRVLWIDAERSVDAFSAEYMRKQGVDIESLVFVGQERPMVVAEEVLPVAIKLLVSGEFSGLVVDSVAALVPAYEAETLGDATASKYKPFGERRVSALAGVLGQAMKQIAQVAFHSSALVLLVNQMRVEPGFVFGNPEYTPGGNAIKHHASIRMWLRRKSDIKAKDGKVIGNLAQAKVQESKVSPRGRVTGRDGIEHLQFYYDGRDVDDADSLVRACVWRGVVRELEGGEVCIDGTDEVDSQLLSVNIAGLPALLRDDQRLKAHLRWRLAAFQENAIAALEGAEARVYEMDEEEKADSVDDVSATTATTAADL